MKTNLLFAVSALLLLAACTTPAPSTIAGSTQNFAVNYPAPLSSGATFTVQRLGTQDNIYIASLNATEKNFSVTLYGYNNTNGTVTETISLNGTNPRVSANQYVSLVRVDMNQTITQGFTVAGNTSRGTIIMTANSTNTVNYWTKNYDDIMPDFIPNTNLNTTPMRVSQFTEIGYYVRCDFVTPNISITPYVSPNGVTWYAEPSTLCSASQNLSSITKYGVQYVMFNVNNPSTNTTRGFIAVSAK